MMEMMFGAASPMWTAMPSTGGPFGLANRPISAPSLGPPAIAGGIGGPSAAAQPLPAPGTLTAIYGAQPTLSGPSLAAVYPLAASPATALFGAEGFLTPSSLLSAVAMHRGQPQGPTNDQEVEEFIYDALELLPGTSDVEVRCEAGRATLTGSVQHKRLKRDAGEIAWAIPSVLDVQNNVSIASRRRGRGPGREAETPATAASPRKQA